MPIHLRPTESTGASPPDQTPPPCIHAWTSLHLGRGPPDWIPTPHPHLGLAASWHKAAPGDVPLIVHTAVEQRPQQSPVVAVAPIAAVNHGWRDGGVPGARCEEGKCVCGGWGNRPREGKGGVQRSTWCAGCGGMGWWGSSQALEGKGSCVDGTGHVFGGRGEPGGARRGRKRCVCVWGGGGSDRSLAP
eukprot:362425-Chlamydomonas_euryale.AAC.1